MPNNFRSISNNPGNSDSFEGKKYNPTGQENCWVELDFFILSFFNIMWSRRDVLRQKNLQDDQENFWFWRYRFFETFDSKK